MIGETGVSVEKDFLATINLALPGYPISCQIENLTMRSELVFKKTILVFGKYDLVFCYPDTVNELEPGYNATSSTCTFCEPISLAGSDLLEMLSAETIEIQPAFIQPLNVWIKLGRLSNLKFWERLKSLLLRKTSVEVVVAGRIAAAITRSDHRNTDLEIEESQPQFRDCAAAQQDVPAGQQPAAALDIEDLAGQVQKIISRHDEEKALRAQQAMTALVQKIISQREEAKASLDLEAITALVQKIISQHEEAKASAIPPGQEKPEVLNMAKVTEVVLNILHARETARASQEQRRSQPPTPIERQGFLNAPRPEAARPDTGRESACGWNGKGCQPAPALLPDQIPSRPGFHAVIHNPPPKPPEYGG